MLSTNGTSDVGSCTENGEKSDSPQLRSGSRLLHWHLKWLKRLFNRTWRCFPQEWISRSPLSSTAIRRGGLWCVTVDEGLEPTLVAVMEPPHPSGGEPFTGSQDSSWEDRAAPPLNRAAAAMLGRSPEADKSSPPCTAEERQTMHLRLYSPNICPH